MGPSTQIEGLTLETSRDGPSVVIKGKARCVYADADNLVGMRLEPVGVLS